MILYVIKRIFYLFPLAILISILSFIIIQLPPGDYVTEWEYNMIAQGYNPTEEEILMLKERLNKIYSKHTGKTVDEISKALERDNFMTAEEAKKFGLIDSVVEKRK